MPARRLRRLDAEVLVAHVAERDRAWLLAHLDEPMPAPDRFDRAGRAARGRESRSPTSAGSRSGTACASGPTARALIPRPETELLVDAAVAEIADAAACATTADRGVGRRHRQRRGGGGHGLRHSEAIALGRLRLIASDISADALELAAENLRDARRGAAS